MRKFVRIMGIVAAAGSLAAAIYRFVATVKKDEPIPTV